MAGSEGGDMIIVRPISPKEIDEVAAFHFAQEVTACITYANAELARTFAAGVGIVHKRGTNFVCTAWIEMEKRFRAAGWKVEFIRDRDGDFYRLEIPEAVC
jgi:hypothetical protein